MKRIRGGFTAEKQEGWRLKARKTSLVLIALTVVVLLIIPHIGNISAYYADMKTKVNHAVIGFNEIEIDEAFEEPDEIDPGDVVNKTVRVKNTGSVVQQIKRCFNRHIILGCFQVLA